MDDHDLVARFGLEAHPEGGWYRRTWLDAQGRASSILYFIGPGERSRWHRVGSVELWSFCAGHPLDLEVSFDGTTVDVLRLGSGPDDRPQVVVAAAAWQRAVAPKSGTGTLVTCVVVPAFRWADFELAPEGWQPGDGGVGSVAPRR